MKAEARTNTPASRRINKGVFLHPTEIFDSDHIGRLRWGPVREDGNLQALRKIELPSLGWILMGQAPRSRPYPELHDLKYPPNSIHLGPLDTWVQGCGIEGFIPTSAIQGNPLFKWRGSLWQKPCCCITEVDSISHSPAWIGGNIVF